LFCEALINTRVEANRAAVGELHECGVLAAQQRDLFDHFVGATEQRQWHIETAIEGVPERQ
jgi:hypothetical protein